MTFGQLRTFVEVARAGSIRGAAAALVVTEPSVSSAVGALARELEVSLIEPAGRGIRLTAAGRELARYATQILGLSERAIQAAREAAGAPGHLRIAGVTTAGEYVLPVLLAQYRERHPEIQISLEVGNRATAISRLIDRETDLAVGGRPPPSSGIAGEAFLDNELSIVAHPDHPLRKRRSIQPSALSEETWLLREPGSGTREATEEFWSDSGIAPRSVMTVGSNGAIKHAATAGLGITLISLDAVTVEIQSGIVVRLRVQGTPLQRPWHVLYVEGSELSRSAMLFLALLRSQRQP
jgi:LysR family transcriptional regulator, low CO2-responsive transcriptional regulator